MSTTCVILGPLHMFSRLMLQKHFEVGIIIPTCL